MMAFHHKQLLASSALAAFLTFGATSAQAWTIDFEADSSGNNMVNGQVLDNEYAAGVGNDGPGVTIAAQNFSPYSGHPDTAVVFDSSLIGTRDGDLESPFTPHIQGGSDPIQGSNVYNALQNPGNIAIIQENTTGCSDGVCDLPDDEARGGIISFVFDTAVTLLSLDVFDIDGAPDPQNERGWIRFYGDASSGTPTQTIDILGNGGDNNASRIVFAGLDGISNVSRIEVQFSSSGGLSNLIGSSQDGVGTPVPAPGTLALLGLGLLFAARRRKALNS
jgi:hypothetical protein